MTAAFLRSAPRHGLGRQRGLSLVELMTAMTLGLLVIAAVASVYLGSHRSFRESEGMERLQETSRAALLMLAAPIRNAGYRPDPRTQNNPAAFFTSPQQLAVFGASTQSPKAVYPFAVSALASSDYIALSYLGNDDGSIGTCLAGSDGAGGPAVKAGQIATNVFYIGKGSSDAVPSLYCATIVADAMPPHANARTDAQPLLLGVTALTVRYGIDSDGDDAVDRYLDAKSVNAAALWTQVRSVQLDITVASPDTVTVGGSIAGTLDKGRLQRRLRQTIVLRNPLTF